MTSLLAWRKGGPGLKRHMLERGGKYDRGKEKGEGERLISEKNSPSPLNTQGKTATSRPTVHPSVRTLHKHVNLSLSLEGPQPDGRTDGRTSSYLELPWELAFE